MAVGEGFEEVFFGDVLFAGEVGDGAGDFEDAVEGAGAELESGDGVAEHIFAGGGNGAELSQIAAVELGVAEES